MLPPVVDSMKDLTKIRVLSLLGALGLLYVGMDRVFFDGTMGNDALSWVQRILTILVGILLSAVSISLLVVAWRGGFPVAATNTGSTSENLLAHAMCAAPSAFVVGAFLIRTIKTSNLLDLTVAILSAVSLVFVLLWTRGAVRKLGTRETAKKHAVQFLWSCIFFSMQCFMLGMAVSGYVWFSTDFLRRFGLVFWSAMTAVSVYPVRRDAKRLADAAGPSRSATPGSL